MKHRLSCFVILIICVSACVTTKAALLDPMAERFPIVSPDSVRVFTVESELEVFDYVRVAIIEATGSGEFTSQTGMIEAMRKKVGLLGGNGVLLPQINEPGAGAKIAGAIFGTGTQRKGNAIAIRILGRKHQESVESEKIGSETSIPAPSGALPADTAGVPTTSDAPAENIQKSGARETITIAPNEVAFACGGLVRVSFQDRGWNDQRLEFNGIEGMSKESNGPFKGSSITPDSGKQFYILLPGRALYNVTIVALQKSITLEFVRY